MDKKTAQNWARIFGLSERYLRRMAQRVYLDDALEIKDKRVCRMITFEQFFDIVPTARKDDVKKMALDMGLMEAEK